MKRAVFTAITKSYLPYARVLAGSLRRLSDDPLYVVVLDDYSGQIDPAQEPFHLLGLPDVLPETLRAMTFYYSPFELCCAIRPFIHRYMMERTDAEAWLFLDSDIRVFGALDPLFEALEDTSILLSPHVIEPRGAGEIKAREIPLLRYGVFNGGCLGLRRGETAAKFVDWLADRLVTACFDQVESVYVDQKWLNLIPAVFADHSVLRHAGTNVGYWNLHERRLEKRADGGYTANGEPLLFFHYSQWAPEKPEDLSAGREMKDEGQRRIAAELGRIYAEELKAGELARCREWRYSYATFADGAPISTAMRRHYFTELQAGRAPAGDPFALGAYFRRRCPDRKWRRKFVKLVQRALGV